MENHPAINTIRNPFAGTTDEKAVWKKLSENSRPIPKDEFLEKVEQARELRKGD